MTIAVSVSGNGPSAIFTFTGSGWRPHIRVNILLGTDKFPISKEALGSGSFFSTDVRGLFKGSIPAPELNLSTPNFPEGTQIEFQGFDLGPIGTNIANHGASNVVTLVIP